MKDPEVEAESPGAVMTTVAMCTVVLQLRGLRQISQPNMNTSANCVRSPHVKGVGLLVCSLNSTVAPSHAGLMHAE